MTIKPFTKITALLLLFVCVGCESSEQKEKRQQQEQATRIAKDMADLSSRHNAITDWQQPLKNASFSIDVEPLFLRSDHRPFLFYATLEDVKRQHDVIVLYFRTTPTEGEPTLQLVLDCNGCDLQKLKEPKTSGGDFGVVAEPTAVSKAIDGPEDGPDFILNGKFIEARFVNNYALDKAIGQH